MDAEKITSFIQALDKKKKELDARTLELDRKRKEIADFQNEISQISELLTINSNVDFVSKEDFEGNQNAKIIYNGQYCKVSLDKNYYTVFVAD